MYDGAAALAVAKSFGDNGERIRYVDDLESIRLHYSDLIEAREAQGAINISGC